MGFLRHEPPVATRRRLAIGIQGKQHHNSEYATAIFYTGYIYLLFDGAIKDNKITSLQGYCLYSWDCAHYTPRFHLHHLIRGSSSASSSAGSTTLPFHLKSLWRPAYCPQVLTSVALPQKRQEAVCLERAAEPQQSKEASRVGSSGLLPNSIANDLVALLGAFKHVPHI